jgi:hypothetical protein
LRQHHEFERYSAAFRICPLCILRLAVQTPSPWSLFSIVYSHFCVCQKRHFRQICRFESLQVPHARILCVVLNASPWSFNRSCSDSAS